MADKVDWKPFLFSYRGRIGRLRFLAGFLVNIFAVATLMIIMFALETNGIGPVGMMLPIMVIFWMTGALMVKRLHDRDQSGWWVLFFMTVPSLLDFLAYSVGGIPGLFLQTAGMMVALWFLIELFIAPGLRGANRFGPDPRERTA